MKAGVDILIATPGRLLDLIGQNYISLKDIGIFVLDEADRMLDMGFINDVKKVVARLPVKRQTLFFSATMPPEIQKLANTILVKATKSRSYSGINYSRNHSAIFIFRRSRKKRKSYWCICCKTKKSREVLVFIRTKHGADKW